MSVLRDHDGSVPAIQDHLLAAGCIDGVAHDVNNYLGTIMAYAELIGMEAKDSDEVQRMVGDILHAVQRSTEILDTLAGLAARSGGLASAVDLEELTRTISTVFRHDIKRLGIVLEIKAQGDCLLPVAVRSRLRRAIAAIIRDAIERVRHVQPRKINLELRGGEDVVTLTLRDSSEIAPDLEVDDTANAAYLDDQASAAPLGLAGAVNQAIFHKGKVEFDPEKGLVLTLPRNSGLDA